ncbi:MAG: hypothetical protein KDC38_14485 [Planctomycetes bacterium]|nr:hypothetical protein [Planctomycetota bacterium]
MQLYLSGQLLPPAGPDEERPLDERLADLTTRDVEEALAGDLGAVPMTRTEYRDVVADILGFVRAWLGPDEASGE